MKSLIIGAGQVGSALYQVLKPYHEVLIKDLGPLDVDGIDVMHICYPDHDGFEITTKNYADQYKPELIIIHSSVRVGTTAKCGEDVVYSPTRGRHPRLAEEMKLFPKFLASENEIKANEAFWYFKKCDWEARICESPESLEFLKVISNVHMGLEIVWRQEVQRMMDKLGISTEDYEKWENSYREGCWKAFDFNLIRPIMRPDPIGGHCILPCLDLLMEKVQSDLLKMIKDKNQLRIKELSQEPAGRANGTYGPR